MNGCLAGYKEHCWHWETVVCSVTSEYQLVPMPEQKACCRCGTIIRARPHGDQLPCGFEHGYDKNKCEPSQ